MDKSTNNFSDQSAYAQKYSQTSMFRLSDFDSKRVEVNFSLKKTSSDAGLLLLREVDNKLG